MMRITLATNPQSNISLLKRGIKLYAASIKQVYGLALLLSIILFLPRLIAVLTHFDMVMTLGKYRVYRLLLVFIDIFSVFVFTAMLWRIRCVVTNAHESILDDFNVAINRMVLIIGAALVYSLLLAFMGLVLGVFPLLLLQKMSAVIYFNIVMGLSIIYFLISVYFLYLFLFYLPLILTEQQGIFASLKKSASLVWGHWWRVFFLMITPWLVYFLTLLFFKHVLGIPMNIYIISPATPDSIVTVLINAFIFSLFLPFFGALLLLQLRDLELRKQV